MRLFFATDLHGSEACWRKLLRAAEFYQADIVICGGDLAGKAIQLILDRGGQLSTTLHGVERKFGRDELPKVCREIADQGHYPIVVEPDEASALLADEEGLKALHQRLVLERLGEWVALADERLDRDVVLIAGNDDPPAVDEVLAGSRRLINGEGDIVELAGGFRVVSSGWTSPTPWQTYREEPEESLQGRFAAIAEHVARSGAPADRVILNFHCPPYGTALDEAPALDPDLQATGEVGHVGSRAVRALIETLTPALSLHGHVHEARAIARLGPTLAINPGSSYQRGILLGALVELPTKKAPVNRYSLTWG